MKSLDRQNIRLLVQKVIWKSYLPAFINENLQSIKTASQIGAFFTLFITFFYIIIVDLFILNYTTFILSLLKILIISISLLFIYLSSFTKNFFFIRYATSLNITYQISVLSLYFLIIVFDKNHYSYYFHAFTVLLIGLNIILWIPPRIVVPVNISYVIGFVTMNHQYFYQMEPSTHHALHDTVLAIVYSSLGIAANVLINFWRFVDFRDNLKLQKTMEKLKVRNHEIHQLSQSDELTGLYNRRFLLQQFEFAVNRSRRGHYKLGLMILDLDFLKVINDKYGHVQGDITLKHLAKAIKQRIRNSDVAARIGGDEFCILFENINKDKMIALAEEIRKNIESEKIEVNANRRKKIKVTSSIGCTVFGPTRDCNFDRIYYKIDMAMYESKKKGRNKTTYIEPGQFS